MPNKIVQVKGAVNYREEYKFATNKTNVAYIKSPLSFAEIDELSSMDRLGCIKVNIPVSMDEISNILEYYDEDYMYDFIAEKVCGHSMLSNIDFTVIDTIPHENLVILSVVADTEQYFEYMEEEGYKREKYDNGYSADFRSYRHYMSSNMIPSYLEKPLSLEEIKKVSEIDYLGCIKANVAISKKEFLQAFTKVDTHDKILDLISEKICGNNQLSGIAARVIGCVPQEDLVILSVVADTEQYFEYMEEEIAFTKEEFKSKDIEICVGHTYRISDINADNTNDSLTGIVIGHNPDDFALLLLDKNKEVINDKYKYIEEPLTLDEIKELSDEDGGIGPFLLWIPSEKLMPVYRDEDHYSEEFTDYISDRIYPQNYLNEIEYEILGSEKGWTLLKVTANAEQLFLD